MARAHAAKWSALALLLAAACCCAALETGAHDSGDIHTAVQSVGHLPRRSPLDAARLLGASGGGDGPGVHDKFRLTPRTALALALACVCALMANAAGIGGGPIYLPLLMVVVGFELTPATALSHTIVATSAVASSIYGLIASSPNDPARSLIDWDLAIFIPPLLAGVAVGVLFNVLLPRWLQTILLTVLLAVVVVKTWGKARKMRASERKDAQMHAGLRRHRSLPAEHEADSGEEEGILHEEAYHVKPHRATRSQSLRRGEGQGGEVGSAAAAAAAVREAAVERVPAAKSAVRGCLGRQPFLKIAAVVLLWAAFLAFQQAKSRHGQCTRPYLLLFVGEVALLLALSALGVWHTARQTRAHPEAVDPELREVLVPAEGSGEAAKSPARRLAVVALVMAFSGALAGLLGIGGALIFNPFLLALGVHPQVTAATSVLMILFSSSAIAISLGFQGYLNASYAAAFAPAAFAASILGVTLISRLIKRTGHTSIIVFILCALIATGMALTAGFGSVRSWQEFQEGHGGFKPLC